MSVINGNSRVTITKYLCLKYCTRHWEYRPCLQERQDIEQLNNYIHKCSTPDD